MPPGSRTRIGSYQLLGLLGAGGMGEVYLARADTSPVRPGEPLAGLVALKTVLAGLDLDDGFRVRFRREIAAAGAVRSPHTAALVAGDATGHTPWLATEYVPGPSLAEAVMRTGPLPEDVVRAAGSRLALALADMHAVRVLHRDLKPGNVLLGADGPKVIDFGIAQAFEATQLTRTGVVVGSPGYISPEHVNGSRALVPASDMFCLGAVLAFAACGRGPFDDPDMAAVIFRIAHGEPELGGVPPGLRPVIEHCLAPRPEDRPDPAELARMLRPDGLSAPFPWHDALREQITAHTAAAVACAGTARVPAGLPPGPDAVSVAHMPTAPPGGPRPADADRRSRRRLAVAAAAGVVVCAVLGAFLLPGLFDGSGEAPPAGGGASSPRPTVSGPADEALVVVPAADAGHTGDFGSAAADAERRPDGWRPWTNGQKIAENGCVLVDATLACSGHRGVTALDASSGKQRWNVPEPPGAATTGTAGHEIAAVEAGTLYAFMGDALVGLRLTDGEEVWRKTLPKGYVGMGPVHADGVLYYVAQAEGGSRGSLVAQQLTGARPEKWRKPYSDFSFTTAAADGRLVVVGSGVEVFDPETGAQAGGDLDVDGGCGYPVLFEHELLCSGEDGITVLDLSRPSDSRTIADGVPSRTRPAVSHDGTVVMSDGSAAYAFELAGGRQLWSTVSKYGDEIDADEVLISGGSVLFGDGRSVAAYDLDASGAGKASTDSKVFGDYGGNQTSRILAVGDVLFLSLDDGTVLSNFAP
ncbi:protein kinase [Streptomyces sp. NBC_00059]|uniref:serine/threonine-protein kinase n=1 Tax=Streptomyces sp. NBC_00059 TaxID=2975635 RepID=UPI002253E1A2|nr:serine/threonine-protein kinase [Streptomyces sp. NBC_00059]MCX5416663.1 serine/threonine-protein kinase [Streptomyces sp. NBC_00059]